MLQASKLTKLDAMSVGVEGEPELEGEMIVGPKGEALRPLGKDVPPYIIEFISPG